MAFFHSYHDAVKAVTIPELSTYHIFSHTYSITFQNETIIVTVVQRIILCSYSTQSYLSTPEPSRPDPPKLNELHQKEISFFGKYSSELNLDSNSMSDIHPLILSLQPKQFSQVGE